MIFDDGHISCAKKHDETWYILDSLENGSKLVELESICDLPGLGWIVLWENDRVASAAHLTKAASKHR